MKKIHTIIGVGIICVCLLLVLQYLQTTEPFLAMNQCPAGFTFFTDLKGASFCCKGTVKEKQCMAKGNHTFCGLAPNLVDPRTNLPLPTCTAMMDEVAKSTSGKYCTKEMPNYIAPGTGPMSYPTGGCSVAAAAGDGSVFPVGPDGNRVATPLCLISGKENLLNRIQDEQKQRTPSCETLKLKEMVKCPSKFSVSYDPMNYVRCISSSAYDPKNPSPGFCYADEVVALLPGMNREKAKTHCISCSYYKKRYVDKDTTAKCTN
jgi:hypothetical protein